ncbi:MAG: penicillin-binding protein activator LpoB [Microcoleus sp. PH2017_10_PVI_O_A]|uniref:CsgG/HfaB family protein n=1 Tax=unclassified Microcoleus TaxID=2642155 RepID=UPI001DA7C528|nr:MULTISPECIES: CsgG/HfaB family protein [unclassified Microcoleus]TAE84741.1 MAG: penicillin-binding protein activator LpoB [Oscillatoriales cyanobacterium]MCC3405001.1 penicillin-binding protein activator LpoB [Microcoleus sp. PH2017_10_PVI_O_A]MCC3458978.1 penicillin-binding protein activator LpoB [Microcoleus sp. PH2017_11_PCY_U_A]MCC3477811.1 penicillin-binding protein activator LpoB [Microcoleus sp. PH2017_12_PCY_D_A]MCC3527754.1 penicillin-binding protein activator LpoB [Microcoleus sp
MKTTTISRLTSISLATLMLVGVSVNAIATPATTQPATQLAQATAKKRLVVMDFDYGTTNSYYSSYRGVGAAKGISEMLINELVNNGTYTVVDRSKLEQVLKQENRSGSMDAGTAAEIGKKLGVDAVLIGTITKFNIDKQSGGGSFMGIGGGSQKTKATVQIDVRLIGTASGDILATAKAVGEADQSDSSFSVRGIGGNSGSSNEDGLLSAAVDKAVAQMVTKLAEVSKKLG